MCSCPRYFLSWSEFPFVLRVYTRKKLRRHTRRLRGHAGQCASVNLFAPCVHARFCDTSFAAIVLCAFCRSDGENANHADSAQRRSRAPRPSREPTRVSPR